jgi:hypothetical protein
MRNADEPGERYFRPNSGWDVDLDVFVVVSVRTLNEDLDKNIGWLQTHVLHAMSLHLLILRKMLLVMSG